MFCNKRCLTLLIVGCASVIGCMLFIWQWDRGGSPPATVAFSDFLREIEAGKLYEVEITDQAIAGLRRDGTRIRTVPPTGFVASSDTFIASLMLQHIRIEVPEARPVSSLHRANLISIVFAFCFLALMCFTAYRIAVGRIPSFDGKTRTIASEEAVVTFADVAGVDEAKDEVREIVEFLRQPQKFSAVGGRIPKGVLLVGPPGTGKTLLARSIAGEAGVPFVSSSGSDFVEMYAGVGASRVRRLFRNARKHQSCIVFIDELDAVGRNRGSGSLSHEEREQTLNQLLVEMDGFDPLHGVVVIAATNRPDILDPALLRPGRFDRQITVGSPDVKGREDILHVHTRKVRLTCGVDIRAVARGTPGFSGADLANLVNEAALLAARAGRTEVSNADLESARDKVLMGVERRSLIITERERLTCAYHEAGHAVVAALMPDADPLHKVTIVPRGRALGITMQLPEADRHTYSKRYLEAQLAVIMGGRVAEELFLDQMTSGAGNDIERATQIAQQMVCEFGMSSLGPLAYRKTGNGADTVDRRAGLSEATAQIVDDQVRVIVMRGYETARTIIETHSPAVRALAKELLASESLEADDVRAILTAVQE